MWSEDPPDLVILETLDAFPSDAAIEHLGMVVELGLPVWLSFRMNAAGFCDAEGRQLRFFEPGRLAHAMRGLEHAEVDALLVNCLPAPLAADAVRTLRATTHVPLGCYPNAAARTAPGHCRPTTSPGTSSTRARPAPEYWAAAAARARSTFGRWPAASRTPRPTRPRASTTEPVSARLAAEGDRSNSATWRVSRTPR